MQYGMLHIALQLGPVILDWNNSSLIVRKLIKGGSKLFPQVPMDAKSYFNRMALSSIDLEFIDGKSLSKDDIPKVCKLIAE